MSMSLTFFPENQWPLYSLCWRRRENLCRSSVQYPTNPSSWMKPILVILLIMPSVKYTAVGAAREGSKNRSWPCSIHLWNLTPKIVRIEDKHPLFYPQGAILQGFTMINQASPSTRTGSSNPCTFWCHGDESRTSNHSLPLWFASSTQHRQVLLPWFECIESAPQTSHPVKSFTKMIKYFSSNLPFLSAGLQRPLAPMASWHFLLLHENSMCMHGSHVSSADSLLLDQLFHADGLTVFPFPRVFLLGDNSFRGRLRPQWLHSSFLSSWG